MPKSRAQKQELVSEVHQSLKTANIVLVAHYKGLTVAEMTDLRRRALKAGTSIRVTKNKLAVRSLEDTQYTGIAPMLKGPTAFATSQDPVAAAKTMADFAKTNEKLVILGGAFGAKMLDRKDVETLAKLPSLDQLRSMLIGLIQTPAQRIASVVQAPAGQVARVIAAKAQKEGS
jgi:large subunit ribosomal protein L10